MYLKTTQTWYSLGPLPIFQRGDMANFCRNGTTCCTRLLPMLPDVSIAKAISKHTGHSESEANNVCFWHALYLITMKGKCFAGPKQMSAATFALFVKCFGSMNNCFAERKKDVRKYELKYKKREYYAI